MRIFCVCSDRGIAPDGTKGASIHLRSLARAFVGLGHEVSLFVARAPEVHARVGVPTIRGCRLEDLLETAAREGAPDLIYERYSLGGLTGLEAARFLGAPFVLEVNAPLVDEARTHRPDTVAADAAAVELELLRGADLVVAVSEPLRRWVAERREGEAGTLTAPNGVDPRVFANLPSENRADEIVFVGHPKPWHGVERLPGILARLPRRVRLVVLGGGAGAESLLEAAQAAGVGDRVLATGPMSQEAVVRRLAESAVSVAPYPPTPFFYFSPLKVVESMAAGTPVVASDIGDIGRVLGDGGVLVPPADDRAFASALESLLEDPLRRRTMGERGRRRALESFTWESTAGRVLDALRSAAERREKR